LTTRPTLIIYIVMTAALSFRKLAQAVLLALVAWVVTAGVASAHGGHVGAELRPPVEAEASLPKSQNEDPAVSAISLPETPEALGDHGGSSCPSGAPTKHAGNCCTVACHAAMATPVIGILPGPITASLLLSPLSDLLEGCCGDRSERPPRLV